MLVKAIFCATIVTACGQPPAVAISDQCVALTDPVLLAPVASFQEFSVGVVDHQVLLSINTSHVDTRTVTVSSRWFDADFRPTTDEFSLGTGVVTKNVQWAAFAGRLYAQMWTVATGDPYATPFRLQIGIDALSPRSTSIERTQRVLPITAASDLMGDLTVMSIADTTGGPGRLAPAVLAHGRPIFALNAVPSDCVATPTGANYFRVMLFDAISEYTHELGDPQCTSGIAQSSVMEAADETLVALGDGLGLFFRRGGPDVSRGRLHFVRVAPDLRVLDEPPIMVDDEAANFEFAFPSGYQTRAAQVDSGPILFTTRSSEDDINVCSNLRLVEPNGASPRDALWQMRCRPPPGSLRSASRPREQQIWAPWISTWIRIEPLVLPSLPSASPTSPVRHAALVFSERNNFGLGLEYATRITQSTDWTEGVYLTTLNGLGQRTSDIVRVSGPLTTALDLVNTPRTATSGPFPNEIPIATASEGDEIVIAWLDRRPDAPGYYARRYQCRPVASP